MNCVYAFKPYKKTVLAFPKSPFLPTISYIAYCRLQEFTWFVCVFPKRTIEVRDVRSLKNEINKNIKFYPSHTTKTK